MSTLEATAVAMPSSNAFAAKFGGAKMQPVPAEAVVTPMEEARQVPRTAQISRRPSDGKKKVGFVGSNEVRFETKRMEIQSRIEAKFHSLPLPAPPSRPGVGSPGHRTLRHRCTQQHVLGREREFYAEDAVDRATRLLHRYVQRLAVVDSTIHDSSRRLAELGEV